MIEKIREILLSDISEEAKRISDIFNIIVKSEPLTDCLIEVLVDSEIPVIKALIPELFTKIERAFYTMMSQNDVPFYEIYNLILELEEHWWTELDKNLIGCEPFVEGDLEEKYTFSLYIRNKELNNEKV